MARARLLKPGFFTNELLAELPFEGRLLFAGLWTLADREGRLEERVGRIKAAVFPFDVVDVASLLAALEARGFIERYTVGAMPLIQIAKFLDHQKPHTREAASTLPAPEHSQGDASAPPRRSVTKTVTGGGNGSYSAEALPRSTPAAAVFLEFSVVGRGEKTWQLSEAQVAEWATDFQNLDVPGEMRKARAWTDANPGRRKTSGGMPKFLVNWLNRATDDRHTWSDRRSVERGSSDRRVGGRLFDCIQGQCGNPAGCRTAGDCITFCKGRAS